MILTKYIFDFDGTLVDSMPIWTEKMLRILDREGIRYSKKLIKKITPLGDIGTAKYFKSELGVKASINEMLCEMNDFAFNKYRDSIHLKCGVLEYLTILKQKGYSLNILTASPHTLVDLCLRNNGVYDLFDNIWSSEDFGRSKDDPRIFQDVTRELKAEPCEIVLFDDNINAIRAASEIGIYTVGVYDESGDVFKDEMMKIANTYISSFTDSSSLARL